MHNFLSTKTDEVQSESGSGIKTILLVLINLILIPVYEKNECKDYLFCFEELENNLHPSILRRLFRFIANFAEKNNCHFFITTHSNVVIDQFSTNADAQIIHVTHDGNSAKARSVSSFSECRDILDDLGARASDILQANGIIWLEGPSDRIYFNRWIEIYAPDLQEHVDYECAFYGGALLKHFDAAGFDAQCDSINIMKVNKNAILIGDSDKTYRNAPLKDRLKNMKEVLTKFDGYVWITQAKEIENYIPAQSLENHFNVDGLDEIAKFQQLFYEPEKKKCKSAKNKAAGYWQKNKLLGRFDKIELAHSVSKHFTKDNLSNRFDLPKEIEVIVSRIRDWNKDR